MTAIAAGRAPRMRRAGYGLLWTDVCYLAAIAIAAAVAVDPLGLSLAAHPAAKHLALLVTVPAVLLALVGRRLRPQPHGESGGCGLAGVLWPLLFLGTLIVAGSLYARFMMGIQNTFLNVGMYMLSAWCAGTMALATTDPRALARGHFAILTVAALIMSAFLVVNYGRRQVYHEQIFLLIPLATLYFAARGHPFLRWSAGAFFLLMAALSGKYTSYLIAVAVVVYVIVMVFYPRLAARSPLHRAAWVYWTGAALLAGGALALLLALEHPSALPTGNPEYRMHTYAAAWQRFLASPLVGTVFAAEAVQKFTLFGIGVSGNVLPTHSDVMDLLANGGIIAVALWGWGLARAGAFSWRGLLRPGMVAHPWAPYAHALAAMTIAGVVTYAFNPILLQPALAYLLWANFGLLVGLSLRAAGKAA